MLRLCVNTFLQCLFEFKLYRTYILSVCFAELIDLANERLICYFVSWFSFLNSLSRAITLHWPCYAGSHGRTNKRLCNINENDFHCAAFRSSIFAGVRKSFKSVWFFVRAAAIETIFSTVNDVTVRLTDFDGGNSSAISISNWNNLIVY